MVFSKRWRESSIDLPGLLPKWVFGSKLWVLSIYDVRSATMAERSFAVVFSRVMGQKAFGNE